MREDSVQKSALKLIRRSKKTTRPDAGQIVPGHIDEACKCVVAQWSHLIAVHASFCSGLSVVADGATLLHQNGRPFVRDAALGAGGTPCLSAATVLAQPSEVAREVPCVLVAMSLREIVTDRPGVEIPQHHQALGTSKAERNSWHQFTMLVCHCVASKVSDHELLAIIGVRFSALQSVTMRTLSFLSNHGLCRRCSRERHGCTHGSRTLCVRTNNS